MKYVVLTLLALLGLLQYRLWMGEGGVVKIQTLEASIRAQQKENEQLLERNRALEAEVRDLRKGVEAIEERARTELGMIRQGETFYQIVKDPLPGAAPSVPAGQPPKARR